VPGLEEESNTLNVRRRDSENAISTIAGVFMVELCKLGTGKKVAASKLKGLGTVK